jgi:hypothetical protein
LYTSQEKCAFEESALLTSGRRCGILCGTVGVFNLGYRRHTKAVRGEVMSRKPPLPVCRAFLVCNQIAEDPSSRDPILVGLPRAFVSRNFPAASALGFFARLTSTHGAYQVEILLQDESGAVVWRDGPPKAAGFSRFVAHLCGPGR